MDPVKEQFFHTHSNDQADNHHDCLACNFIKHVKGHNASIFSVFHSNYFKTFVKLYKIFLHKIQFAHLHYPRAPPLNY